MKTGNKHGHHWITDKRRLAICLRDGLACAYRPLAALALEAFGE